MQKEINKFLDYLSTVRNFSVHTVKNYKKDLEKFSAFYEAKKFTDLASVSQSDIRAVSYTHLTLPTIVDV